MKISAHVAALSRRERAVLGVLAGISAIALAAIVWMAMPAPKSTSGQVSPDPLSEAAAHASVEPGGTTVIEATPSASASPDPSATPTEDASATPTPSASATPAATGSPSPTASSTTPPVAPQAALDNCPQGDFSGSRSDGRCTPTPQLVPDNCPGGDLSGNPFDGTCKSPKATTTGQSTNVSISSTEKGAYECLLTWTKDATGIVTTQGETKQKSGAHGEIWLKRAAASGSTASCSFSLGGQSLGTRSVTVR